ncbi:MAG: lipase family protein [Mangrovibacterium sp.]
MKKIILFSACCLLQTLAFSHILTPNFNKEEYKELIHLVFIGAHTPDSLKEAYSANYTKLYTSESIGLDNQWSLWESKIQNVAAISIRGTIPTSKSWLENLYAAMVAAKGELILSKTDTFKYCLAEDPRATVHIGWLIGTAYIAREVVPKIDSLYQHGIKDFQIVGHSQGGAISCLLHAYLKGLQRQNVLPADICFKTYSSASPKTGNLYFAYYFEHITQDGYAFNVVNTADWVPETPISIQTFDDFNEISPIPSIKEGIKKNGFITRMFLNSAFNKLKKSSIKVQKRYEKYLGDGVSSQIKKLLPDFQPPKYADNNQYMRVGRSIILYADEDYYTHFPGDPDKEGYLFTHHMLEPYMYLVNKLK